MEDIAAYCSWADVQLNRSDLLKISLPPDLRLLLQQSTGSDYFVALAHATRNPQFGDSLLALYKPLYPELVARWLDLSPPNNVVDAIKTLSCISRVLPFATYLRQHAIQILGREDLRIQVFTKPFRASDLAEDDLQTCLLALFRLLSHDRDTFSRVIPPFFVSSLLQHSSLRIRYLAVLCLCLVMHFADAYEQKLIGIYCSSESISKSGALGDWEGKEIDYRLLKLWEEKRWRELAKQVSRVEALWRESTAATSERSFSSHDFAPQTANFGGILLARQHHTVSPQSTFVLTPSSKRNLANLGRCLSLEKPILVCGRAGSGKTALIHEAARLLGTANSMVSLHLNEQTDAKSLLGLYTSSTDTGSFTWQPGVLTKAIQQGRWVLIEDIDRAPADVLGMLRPVLEHGKLFLPNRKETVRPKDGFRIFATLKSSGETSGAANSQHTWLANPRLWSIVETAGYDSPEIEQLLRHRYPRADRFIPSMLSVHNEICALYKGNPQFKMSQSRSPSIRDLLKWSRRLVKRLEDDTSNSISSVLQDSTKLAIFKDGTDCYAGYLRDEELHELVAACIAREMNISPQQMRHALDEGFTAIRQTDTTIRIGRNTLEKVSTRHKHPQNTRFALTRHAQRTLDRISAGASYSEPCLLVGETGVGKTTLVQYIANIVGQKLTVVNLSQQSEATDLLGGLKPVTTRSLILPLAEKFNTLFDDTFSSKRNEKFQIAISKAVAKQNWKRLILLWREAVQMAGSALGAASEPSEESASVHANKRRKLASPKYDNLRDRWSSFSESLIELQSHIQQGEKSHTFSFVEGRLVQAAREGEWLLLDEINLASSDTLDHIVSLLHDGDEEKPSILLTEAGNIESVVAHPNFRVFAAMNPATDTGKKDLSLGLRSRFTEIYVHSGDGNAEDLTKIIQTYLGPLLETDKRAALDLARAYLELRALNAQHKLSDGAGDVPHFSIRSLARCLLYVIQHSARHGLRRTLYEGFAMSFFTVLDKASETLVAPLVETHLFSNVKNRKSFMTQQLKLPFNDQEYVAFNHHLVARGPLSPDLQPHYIRTPSVERNLLNLARATSMRRFPILLQGPTSAGKTSMIEYLAKLSGNKFVRINNHEHTDLQEYLGSYESNADGELLYREGVLVDALRKGHWIVLDELNLAPSDVLEALNRLLDDNRELLIPESQEIVRPHPNFMLFATQNPAGLYGGRKRLSRAFRNRFLELHFGDIPENELEIILRERAQIAPSFCTQIVSVYKKLSLQRQSSRLFEQRNSFATLRDLFRWAARPVDDRQQLAYHGFMLLAERVRDPGERSVVKKIIEETLKVTIDENALYGMNSVPAAALSSQIVWTAAMRRLFVLVSQALKNNEPVLLVGETGCGKTQICQVVAEVFKVSLNIYNAHSNTETGDLIGSQRPVRNRSDLANSIKQHWEALSGAQSHGHDTDEFAVDSFITAFTTLDLSSYDPEAISRLKASIGSYKSLFSWSDGSLIRAMKAGEHFLLDEISLADDSVLERLNSVLEPSRIILLAEKGSIDNVVKAHPKFQFLATMNPGGDYGKRELSAALRNRLTEVWVPPLSQEAEVLQIVGNKLEDRLAHLAAKMVNFAVWFRTTFHSSSSTVIPLRDLLAWAEFLNQANHLLSEELAFVHGAFLIYLDSIGANPAGMTASGTTDISESRRLCLIHLQKLVEIDVPQVYNEVPRLEIENDKVIVGPFSLSVAEQNIREVPEIMFTAPTTLKNTMRIVRALQIPRPILLEGSPGVGKTALVTALAQSLGKRITRINLSDQTDLMDLFGADAPSESESLGRFSWRNGPLLEAMQSGHWVLLDEMNLATQSVLEGLNSCLDHRHEVYIAELDKTFLCHPNFRLFAAQNPHHQGGGRKGLPASFVNRFTVVFADPFEQEDLRLISQAKFGQDLSTESLDAMVQTVAGVDRAISKSSIFNQGGPWELNLRDLMRWFNLCQRLPQLNPFHHFDMIVAQRFRTATQRQNISSTCSVALPPPTYYPKLDATFLRIGTATVNRDQIVQLSPGVPYPLPPIHLPLAKSILEAVNQSWPVILAGASGSGKTSLLHSLAAVCGVELVEFSMNADVDTMDLIGGFEQHDPQRDLATVQDHILQSLRLHTSEIMEIMPDDSQLTEWFGRWDAVRSAARMTPEFLSALGRLAETFPDLIDCLEVAKNYSASTSDSKSRFLWNDGVLVDAVQRGSWLVLDNANLCNASVLDRLNSLLEPDGVLVISEQHNNGNGPRILKPHPGFRIFLTMDPAYGELSRAMRNRSLELFMPTDPLPERPISPLQYPYDSRISRLRLAANLERGASRPDLLDVYFDNLSLTDVLLDTTNNFISLLEVEGQVDRTSTPPGDDHPYVKPEEVCRTIRLSPAFVDKYAPRLQTLDEAGILLKENSPVTQTQAELYTRAWYMLKRLHRLNWLLEDEEQRYKDISPKNRTVIQRAIAARETNSLSREPLPNLHRFVSELTSSMLNVQVHVSEACINTNLIAVCDGMLALAWNLVHLCNARTLDMGKLHAYLRIGYDMSGLIQKQFPLFTAIGVMFSKSVASAFESFESHECQGLQLLWPRFRPPTAATMRQLRTQISLEELLERFDNLCLSLPQSRRSLAEIRTNLVGTYASILNSSHPETALNALQNAVGELEANSQRNQTFSSHFSRTFNHIYQLLQLDQTSNDTNQTQLFAMFMSAPNKSIPLSLNPSAGSMSLCRLAGLADNGSVFSEGTAAVELIHALSTIGGQPLGSLDFVKEELSELITALASNTDRLRHTMSSLKGNLAVVLTEMALSHKEFLADHAVQILSTEPHYDEATLSQLDPDKALGQTQEGGNQFREAYSQFIFPAMCRLIASEDFDIEDFSVVLTNVAMGGLVLMVPGRLYDPAIYPFLESHLHQTRVNDVQEILGSQKNFHKQTLGQSTSLVIRVLEHQLLQLGDRPQPPLVARPEISSLGSIQEIFKSLHQLLRDLKSKLVLLNQPTTVPLFYKGLQRIRSRLENADRAYDDIVKPVMWLVQCLSLGLELEGMKHGEVEQKTVLEILNRTPLVASTPRCLQTWDAPTKSGADDTIRFKWLEHCALSRHLDVTGRLSSASANHVVNVIDVFYHEWKLQLTKDQATTATQSRYYSYRGDTAQDEEAEALEMAQLFPQFLDEELTQNGVQAKYDARSTAIRLAALHQRIYSSRDPQQALLEYTLNSFSNISKGDKCTLQEKSFTELFPVIFLGAESKLEDMSETSPEGLNIYTDYSIVESRKLLELVRDTQARFHNIHDRWPEHAVPIEVLSISEEIMHFSLGEPIAKLLTKTEKLYEIMGQWQSVASREWSAASLMDRLSSLIVSWRRLELSSWSRLLDNEQSRHEEDAKAWYFIAYEAVIYNTLALQQSGQGVPSYCKELARTLEEFFKTTTLGQYSSRLRLLKTMIRTIAELALETDSQLWPVCNCISNVVGHYERFEAIVQTTIQAGRKELERVLIEQVKLASWKDTNVTALRDSAKRSHHKLFKIVRKYRALLEQPVNFSNSAGHSKALEGAPNAVTALAEPGVDSSQLVRALDHCATVFNDWKSRPGRHISPLDTSRNMRQLYNTHMRELQVHTELALFRENLITSIKDLRKETPQSETEENAAQIRHLQERKRRLLTDTIKIVVNMGVRRNLPTTELENQSSASLILASSPDLLRGNDIQPAVVANDAFHDLLDVMPQVRLARTQHSDDLTDGEVGRGVGLLEGILSIVISQRHEMAYQRQNIGNLTSTLELLRGLQYNDSDVYLTSHLEHFDGDQLSRLTWIPQVLLLACRVLTFQVQHAPLDIQDLLSTLRVYASQFKEVEQDLSTVSNLPVGLTSSTARKIYHRYREMLSDLASHLEEWQAKEPRVEFMLRQVIPWLRNVDTLSTTLQNGSASISISQFDSSLKNLVDQLLVALQRLSAVQSEMPKTLEDQGWLIKSNKKAVEAVRAMQGDTICNNLQAILNMLLCLQNNELKQATSLLVVATPIIEQYCNIFTHGSEIFSQIHLECTRLALQLAKSFNGLASEGFCRPSDPSKADEQSGKLESGTGLGEGEGAEDISKDIGEDEDLSELAQNAQKEDRDDEMENAEDAVDMGADDLEGEMGEQEEKERDENEEKGSDDEGDDIDEETGSVDDLDPSAVDEKMWDETKNEAENDKELKNDKADGKKSDDQTGADGEKTEGEEMEGIEGEEMDEEGDDNDSDGGERAEAENMDPHVQDEQALDLPEELNLTGEEEMKDDDNSSDGLNDLPDEDILPDQVDDVEGADEIQNKSSGDAEQDEANSTGDEQQDGTAQDDEVMEEVNDGEEERAEHQTREDDVQHDLDEDAGGDSGTANHRQDANNDQAALGSNQADQNPEPQQMASGQTSEDQEDGQLGEGTSEGGVGKSEVIEHKETEALRKLADVLDQWHQRREILPATQEPETGQEKDVEMGDADLQHVEEERADDAQALGAAGPDQTQNLDRNQAIEDEEMKIDENTEVPDAREPEERENIAERFGRLQAQPKAAETNQGSLLLANQSERNIEYQNPNEDMDNLSDSASQLDIEQLDLHTHPIPSPPTSTSDAAQLWNHCSTTTHQFSLILSEQLRLILNPTTATKLRGDFRSGKRLNIKRIIPYIASGYKRDKIWMRRSIPSKRNYQIMIAVDDSRSMSESGADLLAFETLAMLTKALSMLESGEICVVGFGDEERIRVAHPFGTPFSPGESGVNIFRSFSFNQKGTNVRSLVKQSISLFRDARIKGHSASEDLWQLQLVVSDGHCSDHESIARLVRQAQSEKIIIVFVIVDAGEESILDLKEAVFEAGTLNADGTLGEMKVRTKRYLEGFPFPYYLVVRDVRDLPGVLATALKGWFGSVVDVQV